MPPRVASAEEDDLMLVERILSTARERLVTVGDGAPLIDAAKCLRDRHVNLVVVCNGNGAMVGVITKTDVVDRISHCLGASCTTAASAVMTRDVTFCRSGDWLRDVWSVMTQRGLAHIPVVGQDTRPLGVLYARDVVQALLEEVQDEELLLKDYVMSVGYH